MAIGKTIAILAILGTVVSIPACSAVSAYNTGNRMEQGIKAQYEENQNKLSALSNSVMEAAQVPELAKNDMKEVIEAAMEGRYGPNGSGGAMFQAITEAYPGTLDAALYTKIQTLIESGRRDFAAEQSKLIDKTRVYETALGNFPGGLMMKIVGYPTINLADYKIIVSDYTADAFTSKRDKGLKNGN